MCNMLPWTGFESEKQALENRTFAQFNLKPSNMLKDIREKSADPRFYAEIFEFIRNEVCDNRMRPPKRTVTSGSLELNRLEKS